MVQGNSCPSVYLSLTLLDFDVEKPWGQSSEGTPQVLLNCRMASIRTAFMRIKVKDGAKILKNGLSD